MADTVNEKSAHAITQLIDSETSIETLRKWSNLIDLRLNRVRLLTSPFHVFVSMVETKIDFDERLLKVIELKQDWSTEDAFRVISSVCVSAPEDCDDDNSDNQFRFYMLTRIFEMKGNDKWITYNPGLISHLCCSSRPPTYNMLNFLVQHGAKVNEPESHGNYPLHNATFYNSEKTIVDLLRLGADANLRPTKGQYVDRQLDQYFPCISIPLQGGFIRAKKQYDALLAKQK